MLNCKPMSLPPLFLSDQSGDYHSLSEEDSRHIARVLRLREGQQIHLTNGKGQLFLAELTDSNPRQVMVRTLELLEEVPPPPEIRLCVSPLKNPDRFEWMVEKAVEIGVTRITPLLCSRTESPRVNLVRLQRIIQAALKQSRQYWAVQVDDKIRFSDLLLQKGSGSGFIAYCEERPAEHLVQSGVGRIPAILLIGPEGDFSPEEVHQAIAAGFEPVSLGANRLRTETAALIALHSLHLANR